ncbi:ABC transporter ATP-binding protein [Halarchaeum nitratireducens]|uniref:Molybdate/tungstate import ATP-binding protein WtpC n=1 Tax=Halarchaeum nitratireducens TaxID=489913 RepID=A0A830GC65_9EURY|nr:ABC transporter ATP-binding protein [Halarchaeum nitratireducens]GGN20792.1 polyamine-transporting ATPase [Halarchaeum nitratireducens]
MSTDSQGRVEYADVVKEYGDVTAVKEASFTVEPGEFVALLGPSGAGKTTLLRILAGFEETSGGRLTLDGRDVDAVPPHERNTGMVFQSYALFPHMTVRENIEFGLKRNGFDGDEIDERVETVLSMVDLAGYGDRKPANLSGGQQQRVATARAVAIEPRVLLMDEPLGALDKKLRDQLQVELTDLQSDLGITTLYVTHNQSEALTMADRIVVMSQGRIEQIGTPTEIYDAPATRFVAEFIGDANFFEGDLDADGESFTTAGGTTLDVTYDSAPAGTPCAFVRPERMDLAPRGEGDGANVVAGTVENVRFVGSTTQYYVSTVDGRLLVERQNQRVDAAFAEGDAVDVTWALADTRVVTDDPADGA